VSYWDSSALVKLNVAETDSLLFEQHAAAAAAVPVSSRLALFEIHTALRRKEIEGTLTPGSADTIHKKLLRDVSDGNLRLIVFSQDIEREFDNTIKHCFQHSPPVLVRTLDGIHLASAIAANEKEFVATDKRLRDAAHFLGMTIFP
jgi:predicted nucleic acid-binding protein